MKTDCVIRPIKDSDRIWIGEILTLEWASPRVISRGYVHHADNLPGFVAESPDSLHRIGLLTFCNSGEQCEIVTLNSFRKGIGIGTALCQAVFSHSVQNGIQRVWLITTNDNTQAIRFYQRCGFSMAAFHKDAVDVSRRLKPEIPLVGNDGIPIRHEIEFEWLPGELAVAAR